jgi:hypothetical protein
MGNFWVWRRSSGDWPGGQAETCVSIFGTGIAFQPMTQLLFALWIADWKVEKAALIYNTPMKLNIADASSPSTLTMSYKQSLLPLSFWDAGMLKSYSRCMSIFDWGH